GAWPDGRVPARRRLCRSHPQGRKARRSSGAGSDQVRAGDQSDDRQGSRARNPVDSARPRRRGDRMIRRREVITLLGGAAAWPLTARAQPGRTRRIAMLMGLAENDAETGEYVRRLKETLQALGWSDGQNLEFTYRYAAGSPERARALAGELVALQPDAIVGHTTPVAAALQQATHSIPIIFVSITDPVV